MEPIDGYRLIEPLGRGGFGEVWKCQAPGGLDKALKIVRGPSEDEDGVHALQERQALQFIKNIRHPFILTVERVEERDGWLFVVMELADRNLHDLWLSHQKEGRRGIPRNELLAYLREAAEALDLMNFEHGLQHLDVKPQNLFLVSNHCKVADFGLVNQLAGARKKGDGRGPTPRGVTPRYVAPEVLRQQISRRSDQYSLAIVYQELLCGEAPFKAQNGRQMFVQHMSARPDLNALPAHDRPLIARALAKEPEDRFASCAELVRLLTQAGDGSAPVVDEDEGPRTVSVAEIRAAREGAGPVKKRVLDGYRYDDKIGGTPLGELWRVLAPTGEEKIAYHLQGFNLEDVKEQRQALKYLQSFRQPTLPRFEIAELAPHRIVLLYDPWGASLTERFRSKKLTQEGLLQTVLEAAHALDDLVGLTNFRHLTISPNTLLEGLDGIQLRDFGLAAILWKSEQASLADLNPRYAAPECAQGRPSMASDQYSLARVYADLKVRLLSGKERAPRGADIGLDSLPAPERGVLARALDPDPGKRFASCREMAEALVRSQQGVAQTTTVRGALGAAQEAFLINVADWIDAQAAAARAGYAPELHLVPMDDGSLAHVCTAQLLPGTAKLRLDIFRQEWNAERRAGTDTEALLFVPLERTFWQRVRGTTGGVDVFVSIKPHEASPKHLAEATFVFRPAHCGPKLAQRIREELAPAMVKSLRECLNVKSERRGEDRVPFAYELTVRHRPTGQPPVEHRCTGVNLSKRGLAFLSPVALERREVRILFNLPQSEPEPPMAVFLKAHVNRCRPLPDGRFEIGAEFTRDAK